MDIAVTELQLNLIQRYFIKRKIYKNLKKHLYCVGDIKSTFHVNAYLHKLPEFRVFNNKVENICCKVFGRKITIINMWANVGNFGSKIELHNHIEDKYSNFKADEKFKTFGICGAFYFKKPKLSGDFIAETEVINVNEGELILFSPHMRHCTEENRTNKDRIVISFNAM